VKKKQEKKNLKGLGLTPDPLVASRLGMLRPGPHAHAPSLAFFF
jgi:hypothetical protein